MIEKEIIVEKYGTYYKDIFPLTMILGIFLLGLLAASNNFLIHYLLIISLLLITFFLQQIHRFQKVQKWQSIPAKLKDYKIIKYDRYDKSESNISTPDYEVYILYTYDYKNKIMNLIKFHMIKIFIILKMILIVPNNI